MAQALYRKWRPRLWEQVVGQEHVVQTLQNAIRSQRVGHAYLFAGPRGTGKTSAARLLAKAVNCLAPEGSEKPCDQCDFCRAVNEGRFLDLIEIDAASNTSVDDVRDLRDKINFAPTQGKFKVYIIDEVHMLSTAAFNALLKTLEEPPSHAIFILATTEVHKIPATVLSRCQRHEFRRIPVHLIVQHLKDLADQEGLQVDAEALSLIARQATGAMRDAISLLDQLSSTGKKITLEMAQEVLGTATSQMVVNLVEGILAKDTAAGLEAIHRALDSGSDPRQFARQMVDYLRNLLLIRLGNADQIEATAEQRALMAQHAQGFEVQQLMETLRLFNSAASEVRTGWQPGLLLELALAESVAPKQVLIQAAPVVTSQPVQSYVPPVQQPVTQPPSVPVKAAEPVHPEPRLDAVPEKIPAAQVETTQPVPDAAPTPVRQASGTVSLQTVLQRWDDIRKVVKSKRKQTEALLNSCKSITMRDGILQLGFSGQVLKSKMEMDDNLKITAQAVQQVLGVQLPIVVIDVGTKGGPMSHDADVDADGMVGAALDLGAQIVQKD